jgi:DNA-damage-inducible protein D
MAEISKHPIARFEDYKNQNGIVFWWASNFMELLGYKDVKSFQKVIHRAITSCMSLEISYQDNFIPEKRTIDNKEIEDYKLTRFACYMTAMNGDPKKPEVAAAQVYFTNQTRAFEEYVSGSEDIDRLLIRDEIKEGNKSLAKSARRSGVLDYSAFSNAGYIGLYNMDSWYLRHKRGLYAEKGENFFDHMGRTELAANLFRITQTEEKLKRDKVYGQFKAETTHRDVARKVRNMVIENTGTTPENLPQARKLPEVKKTLKKSEKKLNSN